MSFMMNATVGLGKPPEPSNVTSFAKNEITSFADSPMESEELHISRVTRIATRIAACPIQIDENLSKLLASLGAIGSGQGLEKALTCLVDILIEKAASDFKKRFATGRAVNVILSSFQISTNKLLAPVFWKLFITRVKREREGANLMAGESLDRYFSVASTVAEILGTSCRMYERQKSEDLASLLIQMIGDFITSDDPNKWVKGGQILKQAGSYLEDVAAEVGTRINREIKSHLEELMRHIEIRSGTGNVNAPAYIKSMMANILEIRSHNWGRRHVQSEEGSEPQKDDSQETMEREFHCMMNGQSVDHSDADLTLEELAFLENQGLCC